MEQTVLKIALAGLMHDVGKFAQGCIDIPPDYREGNEALYQPVYDGRYSHQHALYTAAFIEQFQDILPPHLLKKDWGKGDIFLNLAGCHHKPESPMQWIVTQADRMASGLDRASFEKGESIAWRDFKKTRLLPIFEALGPDRADTYSSKDNYSWRYPLAPLSAMSVFPVKIEECSRQEAEEEYKALFDGFVERLKNLHHRDNGVELWAQHFDSLLMSYTAHIPAARVGDVVHDVSLYDHSRGAAAFAAALYQYHQETDTLNEQAIKDEHEEKFLLVSGDFFGIQDFIFAGGGESRKFRSKLLRGRSFAVSLFSELAADMLCRRMGLPFLSVVLNAAGKFHLIAPNTEKARVAIEEVKTDINDWLHSISYGQSSLGISFTPARSSDFHCPEFAALWQRHMDNLEIGKYQKIDLAQHGGVVPDYLDQFNNELDSPLCPLCGKRPAISETKGDRDFRDETLATCAICRDHVMLGTLLVKKPMLAVCTKDADMKGKGLLSAIFDQYQVKLTGDNCNRLADQGQLLKLWELNCDTSGKLVNQATTRLINGYVPVYTEADNNDDCLLDSSKSELSKEQLIDEIKEGVPKTLNHIALKSLSYNAETHKTKGTEALGILKADVDNLGMLFGCGFSQQRFTFSRLATLSRQLNTFFSHYLPHLLRNTEEFNQVYTVFAGGDDLFLIGPWNRMAELAAHLRRRFSEYVCGNPEITFSAGITVHKPHVPIDKLAESSEEALAAAKNADSGKNRLSMFEQTVTWRDFKSLQENRQAMQSWLDRKLVSRVMFYRLNHFVRLAEQEGRLGEVDSIPLSAMDCVKWPAMFQYNLARNVNTKTPAGEKAMEEVAIMAQWLQNYRGAVRIPLWQILYQERS